MILDHRLIFSEAQDIGQVAGSYPSSNYYDNGVAQTAPGGYGTIEKDIFKGDMGKMVFLISIIEAVTSGGAATIDFQVVQATDAALTTSVDVLQSTGPIAYTALTAGKRIHLSPPAAGLTKRYWGLRYVVAAATTTAGTVTASLVRNVDTGLAT